MKTVAVYYAGIPPKNTKLEKRMVLTHFAAGVRTSTDVVNEVESTNYFPTDLAVIQGWVHENSQTTPHLMFRKKIIESQKDNSKHTLAIDSNLFLYKDPENTRSYLRFSLDGIFPTTGNYFDSTIDESRWNQIKQDIGFDLQPWRNFGNHILICLQRNGGWSMQGLDVMNWCLKVIMDIRQYSNRPIVVRGHPGDRNTKHYLRLNLPNVKISSNDNLLDDLKGAWATVTYNSSPGVASIIEGIPVFVTDPIPQNSQTFPVCNVTLQNIETPVMPDNRLEWIQRISMSHWNFDDLRSGKAWSHMRSYV